MLLPELRAEVARYARKMQDSGLVRATQGNLSARDPETGMVCITPSGADYQQLQAEDITVVDANGNPLEGKWQPSVETPLHTLVLRRRPDINCVMHTHSPYATAFGVIYQPFPMILAESALCLGGEVPIAPYRMSGTPEFAELVADTLGQRSAVIWGNHGVMVVGVNLALTFSIAHALEDSAKVYSIAKQLGEPVHLPADEVDKLHKFWTQHYGKKELEPSNS
ncbi:class II aldolase/adducin family protein [Ktedonosporobacter rubrisoli]|uniref:Class II aldolase/adducin family protein n=1 Tax=Ktedonosporobacter rubrisoli TaxID=2509675 RepID=A0A4P6JMY2_KTERU|nr:class II aldolase/adducin family protein [Ktedonosporobacter rubrisoli]QBD76503.1 class II aldolase/adducin family protein [Ktedonosporobacter rubrisoli]